jgi:antitoxin HigA-1
LSITTEVSMAIPRDPNHPGAPVHPGEMLREEFMVPLGLSANALALALRVPSTRISEIVAERRSITADTAYRLARYFGMPARFWMDLQSNYELAVTYKKAQQVISKEVHPRVARIA